MRRLVRNDVRAASVTEVVEAHLDANVPAEVGQELGDRFLKGCMRGVDEPIQLLPAPDNARLEARVQRLNDILDSAHRHVVELAALELRNKLARDAATLRQVNLSPATPDAQDAHGRWQVRRHL
jgi:hypothetical protein